jgi:hypothetical protein
VEKKITATKETLGCYKYFKLFFLCIHLHVCFMSRLRYTCEDGELYFNPIYGGKINAHVDEVNAFMYPTLQFER